MAEAVEQRGGQHLVAEDLDPLRESQFGIDDRGAAFVAVGEQVEEQLTAGPLEGHEAEFVGDQQGDAQVALMQVRARTPSPGPHPPTRTAGSAFCLNTRVTGCCMTAASA